MYRLIKVVFINLLGCLPVAAQSPLLTSFIGKDLQKLSKKEIAPLKNMLGRKPNDAGHIYLGPEPWYVWYASGADTRHFIVFEGQHLYSYPGASCARIHAFDSTGGRIRQWEFSTGWRQDLDGATFSFSNELSAHLITIETVPGFRGRDVQKQYFAFGDERLQFLRIEDSKGNMLQNDYEYPNHTLGIVPENNTKDDWLTLLKSERRYDVLTALVFLGGKHLSPPREDPTINLEEIGQARMVHELLGDKIVGRLIREHANSECEWIVDAAILAAKNLRD